MRANKLAFVQSGMLREFVEIEGEEITKWITSKGYFVVDLGSFVFGQSARWNIQALTDCELYLIDFVDYQSISQVIPKWLELEKYVHYQMLFNFRRKSASASFNVC